MLIEEICNELEKKRYDIICADRKYEDPDLQPKFAIYMTDETYVECMKSINGGVLSPVYEFYTKGTIYGNLVYRVYPILNSFAHPPYTVVQL